MHQELHLLPVKDKLQVALWQITATVSQANKHIFLTHGTLSNKKVMLGLADCLTQKGYTCWLLEWRNHGSSPKTKSKKYSFEDLAKEDFKTALDFLIEQQGITTFDCITHSGGGILLTLFLIHFPAYQQAIKSIVLFACQSFGAVTSRTKYWQIKLGKYGSYLLGGLPARLMASEESEPHFFMNQWYDWNLTGNFLAKDGTDYRQQMSKINLPILAIAGGGDHFIAPPAGCQAFLEAFANDQNQFLVASKANGYQEDYTHSRVLHSRSASVEIYPLVLAWLERY